jgi:hypothetical protein
MPVPVEPNLREAGAAPRPTDGGAAVGWPGDLRLPVLATVVFLVASVVFTLEWTPVVHHLPQWFTPGDIWGTFRSAHYVGWGDIGDIYAKGTGLVTYPGIAVVLAPVAVVADKLQLTESVSPVFLPKPTAWLVLDPANLLLGATTIFAVDRFGRRLGVGTGRRAGLDLAVTVPIFILTAVWGHPEDCLALTFALYALVDVWDDRYRRSGWLWGAAIAMQPLVILLLPLSLARTGRGQRLATCVRAALPVAVLVAIPLAASWSATTTALFRQPNFPKLDHPTPFVALATRLSPTAVSAGPGRLVAVAVAIGLGVVAYRLQPRLGGFVWLCAVALSARCVFESVMDPFYLGPPVVLILCAAATRPRWWPLATAFAAGTVGIYFSFAHWGEWPYWLTMTALLAAGLAAGWPGRIAFTGGPDPDLAPPDGGAGVDAPTAPVAPSADEGPP